MGRSVPSYIRAANVIEKPVNWDWDDNKPEDAWNGEVPPLENKIGRIFSRGILTLSAAFAEWIAFRLNGHTEETLLFEYVDVVRACVVDLHYTDIERSPENTLCWKDWQGPVAGALCGAARQLGEMVEAVNDEEAIAPDAIYLANLVEVVVPDIRPFRSWRNWAINRLIDLDPVDWDQPLGNPLPIECLDPESRFQPKDSKKLLREFLRGLDPKKNRYLRSPSAMKKAGFEGTPYTL